MREEEIIEAQNKSYCSNRKRGVRFEHPRFNYFPLKKINGDFAPLHDYFFFAFFFAFFLVAMCDSSSLQICFLGP
jgi:hypothetical protein